MGVQRVIVEAGDETIDDQLGDVFSQFDFSYDRRWMIGCCRKSGALEFTIIQPAKALATA